MAGPRPSSATAICQRRAHERVTVWVSASRPDSGTEVASFIYEMWSALLDWLDRMLPSLTAQMHASRLAPLHLLLSLDDPEQWRRFSAEAGKGSPEPLQVTTDVDACAITVRVPFAFLVHFYKAANDGERILLETVAEALSQLISNQDVRVPPEDIAKLVADCMGGPDARAIHLFSAQTPFDYIAKDASPEPRLIQREDKADWERGLAWRAMEQRSPDEGQNEILITGRKECVTVLNKLVDVIWHEIRDLLQTLDTASFVSMTLSNNEEVFGDRRWWNRTARAMAGLYGGGDDVAGISAARESERAAASTAGRVLVEMAISTCSIAGGRKASRSDLDRLLAGTALLIAIAGESDAIRGRLARATLRVAPSGRLSTDKSFLEDTVAPYSQSLRAVEFRDAVASYDTLFGVDSRTEKGSFGRYDDPEFASAFTAEFGLSPGNVMAALSEMVALATEKGTLTVETSWSELSSRFIENRGMTMEQVGAFRSTFALAPRKAWDLAPDGYLKRDWYPWIFRRRLSLVARPVLTLTNAEDAPTLYGVTQLAASVSYLFEGLLTGWFPGEYFSSAAMHAYRGKVTNERGSQFTREVAQELRRKGWEVRSEVSMNELGAPKELGDIDVIAWRSGDARLVLCECKRLQPARTVGEIVELLNRFRGEAKDQLGRHLRRVGWVSANLGTVQSRLGVEASRIESFLITNAEVPMQYRKDLALSPDRIGPPVNVLPNPA